MDKLGNDLLAPELLSPAFWLSNAGAPFIIGLAVGYFAKKMLKLALLLAGGAITVLFAAEYFDIVRINDADLQQAAQSAGQAAEASGNFLLQRVSGITAKGVSGAAGFAAGFKLG